jgi:hypothetical protein
MAAAKKTKEQIYAERLAAAKADKKALEKYLKTRPSKAEIAARNNAPVKPMTAAERAARTKAMEAKKRAIMQTRKPATPVPLPKKPLTGPAAIKEIQRQVSPSGVKKAESGAKKGLDKKYPGLYKK